MSLRTVIGAPQELPESKWFFWQNPSLSSDSGSSFFLGWFLANRGSGSHFLAAIRRVLVVSLSRPLRRCETLRETCCRPIRSAGVTSSSSGFQMFKCSPGVLVRAHGVGLLAILGGLLHGVHDLAVLLGEGHNPEMEECLVEFFMFSGPLCICKLQIGTTVSQLVGLFRGF